MAEALGDGAAVPQPLPHVPAKDTTATPKSLPGGIPARNADAPWGNAADPSFLRSCQDVLWARFSSLSLELTQLCLTDTGAGDKLNVSLLLVSPRGHQLD